MPDRIKDQRLPLRRKSREWALGLLYQAEVRGEALAPDDHAYLPEQIAGIDADIGSREIAKIQAYVRTITDGVQENLDEIDRIIQQYSSKKWTLMRMSSIDRNMIRIAVYELLFAKDTPPAVIINEAIEIGKVFGTEESGKFINGILDTIRKSAVADTKP